jgi:hypothetical protein
LPLQESLAPKQPGLAYSFLFQVTYILTDPLDEAPIVDIARAMGIKVITEKFFTDSAAIDSLRNENQYFVVPGNKKRPAGSVPQGSLGSAPKKAKKMPGVPPVDKHCQYAQSVRKEFIF